MISEPEVKNRYSTPPRPMAATIASLASSAWTSVQAPVTIVVATDRPPFLEPYTRCRYPCAGRPTSLDGCCRTRARAMAAEPGRPRRRPKYSSGAEDVKSRIVAESPIVDSLATLCARAPAAIVGAGTRGHTAALGD